MAIANRTRPDGAGHTQPGLRGSLLRPLIRILGWLGQYGTRLLGVETAPIWPRVHTAEEIASMLAASREEGLIEEMAHDLLSGALDFGERPLSDVMVPRDQITWVSRDATVAEAEQAIVTSGHSPVVGGRHRPRRHRRLRPRQGSAHGLEARALRDRPLPLADPPCPHPACPAAARRGARGGVRQSRTSPSSSTTKRHVIGLATLEDVLEDLVGDIRDESDRGVARRITSRRRAGQ